MRSVTRRPALTEAKLLFNRFETEEGIHWANNLFCFGPGLHAPIALGSRWRPSLSKCDMSVCQRRGKWARRFALIGVTGTVRMAFQARRGMWDAPLEPPPLPLVNNDRQFTATDTGHTNSCGLG